MSDVVDSSLLCLLASKNHSHLRWQIQKVIKFLSFPRHSVPEHSTISGVNQSHRQSTYIYLVWMLLLTGLGYLSRSDAHTGQLFLPQFSLEAQMMLMEFIIPGNI